MSIADLSNVLKIFGGSDLDPATQKDLYKEVLLMVLARASSSDASIHPVEIETIQKILHAETGAEMTVQDVRKAARTELYESTSLAKDLNSARKKVVGEPEAAGICVQSHRTESRGKTCGLSRPHVSAEVHGICKLPSSTLGAEGP